MLRKQRHLATAALAAIVPLLPLGAAAQDRDATGRLAMMDMMPMGGGAAPGAATMPGMAPSGQGGRMDDDMMRMGGTPGQAQPQMQMGQAQQPMAGCDMMAMMRDMMRRGAMPQSMPGGAAPGMGPMGGDQPMGSSAARLEGRIAFLRTELRITEAQAPAWDAFTNTLRSGREHLDAARAALQDSFRAADPMTRLASFENHLRERTEAIHMTRMAFDTLYRQFDDAQKRTAATTMLPFIGAY